MSPKSTPRSKTSVRTPIFRMEIGGVDLENKGFSAQSIGVDLVLKARGTFTAKLTGNGISGADASWMEDPLLGIGKPIVITIGDNQGSATVMDGKISSMRANFPADGMPTLEIAGEDIRSAAASKKASAKTISMRWGESLLTFEPEIGLIADPGMKATAKSSKSKRPRPETSTTTGIGECVGSPEIMPGCLVKLEGLAAFSGDYQVLRTVHTVNGTEGYRTMIMVAKQ